MPLDALSLALGALAFGLGGVLKGATGAGAPIICIPILAMLYDVPTAVALFAVPNIVSNIWQAWSYRRDHLPWGFVASFALAGILGAVLGTFMLANLNGETLQMVVAGAIFAYLGFRLARPDWALSFPLARRLAPGAGFMGGLLQGTSGISAPISLTFLNAMRLERALFISTISVFFTAIAVVHLPLLTYFGLMTGQVFVLGTFAMVVLSLAMPVGAFIARYVSRETFDRIILGLLLLIAVRLSITAMI